MGPFPIFRAMGVFSFFAIMALEVMTAFLSRWHGEPYPRTARGIGEVVSTLLIEPFGRPAAAAMIVGLGAWLALVAYRRGLSKFAPARPAACTAPAAPPTKQRLDLSSEHMPSFGRRIGVPAAVPPAPVNKTEMKAMAWISVAMVQPDARKSITNPIIAANIETAIELDKRNSAGEPLGASLFPTKAWVATDGYDYTQLPNLFYGGGFWFVSAKAAAVFRQHDLGAGALYPVEVYRKDRTTPLGDPGWCCLNFGNRKSRSLPERSTRVRPFVAGTFQISSALKDDDFAIKNSQETSPDLWVDPQISGAFFVSERLGKALKKAKADSGFALRRCQVLEAA